MHAQRHPRPGDEQRAGRKEPAAASAKQRSEGSGYAQARRVARREGMHVVAAGVEALRRRRALPPQDQLDRAHDPAGQQRRARPAQDAATQVAIPESVGQPPAEEPQPTIPQVSDACRQVTPAVRCLRQHQPRSEVLVPGQKTRPQRTRAHAASAKRSASACRAMAR